LMLADGSLPLSFIIKGLLALAAPI
jgi:hypothetical protein